MKKFNVAVVAFAFAIFIVAASSKAAITVDGTLDGDYGAALTTQDNQTQFGDSTSGTTGGTGTDGSELDVGHGIISGGTLYLFLGGNLQGNLNKLNIFIDSIAGGQNRLLGGSAGGGLNRMADDGSGNGLKFDTVFAADYLIVLNGDSTTLYGDLLDIPTGTGGSSTYLGSTGYGSAGALTGGNSLGILATINNANTAGVTSGTGAGSGAGVTTGTELAIPLTAIGSPAGPILVSVFVNSGGQDFVSNQSLGGLGGTSSNLGEPRSVDFSSIAGDQYFTVVPEPSTLAFLGLGVIGLGFRAFRRKNA